MSYTTTYTVDKITPFVNIRPSIRDVRIPTVEIRTSIAEGVTSVVEVRHSVSDAEPPKAEARNTTIGVESPDEDPSNDPFKDPIKEPYENPFENPLYKIDASVLDEKFPHGAVEAEVVKEDLLPSYTADEKDLEAAIHRGDTVESCLYPEIDDPVDPARILSKLDLRKQRIVFLGGIIILNIVMAVTEIFGKKTKLVVLLILFIKSKDFLSAIVSPVGMLVRSIYRIYRPLQPVPTLWILSLIPAYSESEEQIVKTIFSLRDNDVEPHRQVMVVVLDGNPRDVRSHMTKIIKEFERPYVSLKWKRGVLRIFAGFMENVPVIVIEKVKNAGKKDSLILCHDLFNFPRENSPAYTKLLRKEIWDEILPALTEGEGFKGFDMVFCTDADSTIYKGAVAKLANAIARDKNAIAACGLVLVELEPGFEWSFWNLYQQFQVSAPSSTQFFFSNIPQYTFGQYVRRRAEGFYGKVTCLPGCITMIAVREEMAGAIRKYAEPVTGYLVVSHQVQYLVSVVFRDRRNSLTKSLGNGPTSHLLNAISGHPSPNAL